MLNARLGDQIIGNAAVNILAERRSFDTGQALVLLSEKTTGIWDLDGRLQRAIIHAGENGFLQIELGVYENNLAAGIYTRRRDLLRWGEYRESVSP